MSVDILAPLPTPKELAIFFVHPPKLEKHVVKQEQVRYLKGAKTCLKLKRGGSKNYVVFEINSKDLIEHFPGGEKVPDKFELRVGFVGSGTGSEEDSGKVMLTPSDNISRDRT